jgi:Acetyl-CoA carboxylase, carboxyltransferase component (subunits alpha and beta)
VGAGAGLDKKPAEILGASVLASGGRAQFTYKTPKEAAEIVADIFDYLDEEAVERSDDPNRTYAPLNEKIDAENILKAVCDDGKYLEVSAKFCPDVKTVLSSINSLPVGIAITNATGKAPKLTKAAIKKIKNFIKILVDFDVPLINFVDSEGIASTLKEEEEGILKSAANLFASVSNADNITKISIIYGSAVGISYTALCSKSLGYDFVAAFPQAKLSALTSDAAVNFIYKPDIDASADPVKARESLKEKYETLEQNPFVSAKDGGVDNIIEPALVRPYLASVLTATL